MIDSKAVIDPSAVIADDVNIGAYTVIGPNVEIGSGSVIGPHVVISCNTKIGKNNKIYQFASIGADNQDLVQDNKPTYLEIGDDNVIHEFVSINRGSTKEDGVTKIGNRNLIMAYAHVGHDSVTGDHVMLANAATLAGHVKVKDYAIIGAFCAVHQFCTVGAYSMVSLGAMVNKDVLPFLMAAGNKPKVSGLNKVGLTRNGFSSEDIKILRQAYKIIFRQSNTTAVALTMLEPLVEQCSAVQQMIDMLSVSKRGIVR